MQNSSTVNNPRRVLTVTHQRLSTVPVLTSLPLHTLYSERGTIPILCLPWSDGKQWRSCFSEGYQEEPALSQTGRWRHLSDFVPKNNLSVPRLLLKNGKQRKDYLESCWQSEIAANSQQEPSPTASLPSHPDALQPAVPMSVSDAVRFSSVMKEVNMLRSDFEGLKREVSFLNRNYLSQSSSWHMHVSLVQFLQCS